jgi:hypothetical protein
MFPKSFKSAFRCVLADIDLINRGVLTRAPLSETDCRCSDWHEKAKIRRDTATTEIVCFFMGLLTFSNLAEQSIHNQADNSALQAPLTHHIASIGESLRQSHTRPESTSAERPEELCLNIPCAHSQS